MKYILISLLLISCSSAKQSLEPKYKLDQKLIVIDGFYKDKRFYPESYRQGLCKFSSGYKHMIIYKGDIYSSLAGHIDVELCEDNLKESNENQI